MTPLRCAVLSLSAACLALGLAVPTGPVRAETVPQTGSETGPVPAPAGEAVATGAETAALAVALRLDDLFAVLRDEGLAHGATLAESMFASGGGPGWATALERIYDAPALHDRFVAVLEAELGTDPAALTEILAFFASDLGARVVGLEIAARQAFLDEAAEEAARVAADKRRTGRDPRAGQLDRFIVAGDLLEMNVAGALSGNLAFMTGLNAAGSAAKPGQPEDELMQDVWSQEAQIRDDTASWLDAYLGLAYQPLTEAELDRYIAFMETPAGQRLNAALFVAFDEVFRQVSLDLGRAAGLAMQGRDI